MLTSSWSRFLLCYLSLILYFSASVNGLIETRTIDDALGDSADPNAKPIYLPKGQWTPRPGNCVGCNINPKNPELAFKGTWHDTTHFATDDHNSTVQFSFTGIALSVFCILPPKTAVAVTNYNLTFLLDGQPVGTPFVRATNDLTNDYQYNVSVLSLDNLVNTQHTFVMQMASQVNDSVTLFDYASYIHNDQGIISETKKNSHLGAILGGVLGSVAFLLGATLLVLFARRRRHEVRTMQRAEADPFEYALRIDPIPLHRQDMPTPSSTSGGYGTSILDTEKGPPPAYSLTQ
ncbi:hypothetical protein L218DRAFT_1074814 [Marasmius fiardii PR-910]|nr:hypothetical protein L218DRAFT_1074814 [Marasmius fiardii PR-910]